MGSALNLPPGSLRESLATKFPRLRVESTIQGWAFLEQFDRGVKEYGQLKDPTPQDDRWVGVCLFQQLDDDAALHYFQRAITRGESAARINLAHLLRFLDRAEEAANELSQVEAADLKSYDSVLYNRVLSLQEETSGNIREALKYAEEAWRKVQGLPEFPIMAPSILSQIGILHSRIGRAKRALWFFDRTLQVTEGFERTKVRIRRASVLAMLGRYDEARHEVHSIDFKRIPEAFKSVKYLILGDVSWGSDSVSEAITIFHTASAIARSEGSKFEEFLAELSLATLKGSEKDLADASNHLSRAQQLITDKSDRLNFRFREILIRFWWNDYSPEHAVEELRAIASEFGSMGLFQEQGWVRLHCCAIDHENHPFAADEELMNLVVLGKTLQNPVYLAREFVLLPKFRDYVCQRKPDLIPN